MWSEIHQDWQLQSTGGPILLLQLTAKLWSMNIETFRPTKNLTWLTPSTFKNQKKWKDKVQEMISTQDCFITIFTMSQNITVIEVESEFDLQHFLENGYNVINYSEPLDYSFITGGMLKNSIFSTNIQIQQFYSYWEFPLPRAFPRIIFLMMKTS